MTLPRGSVSDLPFSQKKSWELVCLRSARSLLQTLPRRLSQNPSSDRSRSQFLRWMIIFFRCMFIVSQFMLLTFVLFQDVGKGGTRDDRNRHNRRSRQNRQNRHGCLFVLYFVGQATGGEDAPPELPKPSKPPGPSWLMKATPFNSTPLLRHPDCCWCVCCQWLLWERRTWESYGPSVRCLCNPCDREESSKTLNSSPKFSKNT